jgi:hypothetical protein
LATQQIQEKNLSESSFYKGISSPIYQPFISQLPKCLNGNHFSLNPRLSSMIPKYQIPGLLNIQKAIEALAQSKVR